MKVYKFGGASVKDAAAVRNVAAILHDFDERPLLVVISAMGKTTNALEKVLNLHWKGQDLKFGKILMRFSMRYARNYKQIQKKITIIFMTR